MSAPTQLTYTTALLEKLPIDVLKDGLCGSAENPDIFFEPGTSDFAEARTFCAACPLISACLQYALANEIEGFWGGKTSEERLELNLKPIVTPERRREAAAIRAAISSSVPVKEVAARFSVTERTVYRYKAQMRKDAGLETPTWIFATKNAAKLAKATKAKTSRKAQKGNVVSISKSA
ncbi:MAG: phage KiSi [Actinomycetota bacterium]|jgi:WhiB family redox-sensing transcriptional regulator